MPAIKLKKGPVLAIGGVVTIFIFWGLSMKSNRNDREDFSARHSAASFEKVKKEIDIASFGHAGGDTEDKPYEALVEWLLRSGAWFPKVSGNSNLHAAGGRALFAIEPLKKGDVIARIPAELWFSYSSVMKGSAVQKILRSDERVLGVLASDNSWGVILGLTYERFNEFSPWRPYMNFIRRQESPVWWSESDLKTMQSPLLYKRAKELQRDIESVYNQLFPYLCNVYPEMFDRGTHTLELFTWASLTMWARAFTVDGTEGSQYGIVPIADLLNHKQYQHSTWSMEYQDKEHPRDPTMFVLEANADYQPGEEITISYGDKRASSNFFIYSGFIPSGQLFGDFIGVFLRREDDSGSDKSVVKFCVGVDGRLQNGAIEKIRRELSLNTDADTYAELLGAVTDHMLGWNTRYVDDEAELAATSTYGVKSASLTFRTRFKKIYKTFKQNLEALVESPSAPAYVAEQDNANHCYHDGPFKHSGEALDVMYVTY